MRNHSKKAQEKKKQSTGIAIAIIITFIMLSSMLAYVLMDTTDTSTKYKNIKFSQDAQGFYSAKIYGKQRTFYTSPLEFSSFNISDAAVQRIISAGGVYLVFDPNIDASFLSAIDQISAEMYSELSPYSIFVQRGITNESSVYSLPVIDCRNATEAAPIIVFELSNNETSLSENGSCMTAKIQSGRDLVAARDSLEFSILYTLANKK